MQSIKAILVSTVVTPSGYLLVETKDAKRLILENTRVVSQINSLVFILKPNPKPLFTRPRSYYFFFFFFFFCVFFFSAQLWITRFSVPVNVRKMIAHWK